ncbi:ATP:cob(I)alamin adenosyltransferase [candidate division WWE3 bacterium RIFCSPHIGHO2_01_FULL_35_17]|uniref:Corrinoid adenosyltransferase n=1 Tax=candidate division WWE3 bacterium RIFCSPHIGHO2_01_FULL_35_17 TaxID=1802614 RepID=A0A1F4URF1_UNCKA|nr:MAG: ATP:cob(I)alamin adenosyltransferase [candidate division WWE3 bacterium RIFCSPHIGHO2_01_FULL_35_17]
MPIYTRTGDKGTTSLFSGQRVLKSSEIIEFIGLLDELNSLLGICVSMLDAANEVDFIEEAEVLEEVQRDLFVVGAICAGGKVKFDSAAEVENLEKTIDDYEKLLSKLKNFILPGGSTSAAQIHFARTFARKVERYAVSLKSPSIEAFLPYLNRLSDLLFVMARFVNHKTRTKESVWKI